MTSTTHIITVMNRAWQAIQRNHPEVPAVMIVTGRRRHKSEGNIRGQHCRETWHVDGHEGRQAEVWVSGERLAEGPEAVMQTMLHEAAHALAVVRGLKDTSNKNRYHNKVFVKLAEELGLEGPESSGGPALGYSDCSITKRTAEVYDYEIKQLGEACKNFVAAREQETAAPRKASVKAFCQCPEGENELTWTKKFSKKLQDHGVPPILCGICRQAFVPEDDPEEPVDRNAVLVHLQEKACLLKRLTGEDL
jgi:hypothetical protein